MDAKMLLSRRWRLENLYWIVNEVGQKVKFALRPQQLNFIQNWWFFNIILKARQGGFTTLIDLMALDFCLFVPNFTAVIIAETKEKAADIFNKKICFPYDNLPDDLKQYCPIRSRSKDGKIVFVNGSSISVMVSARSGTCDFLHISEYGPVCAKFPAKAEEIRTGSIPAVHEGSFIFIESTAMGRAGDFYRMCQLAQKDQQQHKKLSKIEFKLHFYSWHENPEYKIFGDYDIPAALIKYFSDLKDEYNISLSLEQQNWYFIQWKTHGESMWQEYPSYPDEAFKVAKDGAFYKNEFMRIYRENRLTRVPHDPSLPVYTSWDLGFSDDTAIWFWQFYGREARLIDYHEHSGEGLPYYINFVLSKPYRYAGHFAPHDIGQTEFGSGISRLEIAAKANFRFERIMTNLDLYGGIDAVRYLLNYSIFAADLCDAGSKCLESYSKQWDDKNACYHQRPNHDWTSHGADAFRTMAVAIKQGRVPEFNMIESRVVNTNIIKKGGLYD